MPCVSNLNYISTYERRCAFVKMREKIIIKEDDGYIFAVKKEMLVIGNVCVISPQENIYDVYDCRTGLVIATCAIKPYIKDGNTLFELFNGFNTFTMNIVTQRDFLLKKFVDMKMENISKNIKLYFKVEEFEQFLLENQP